jgi:ABC-2 type transport system permease protein
VLKELKELMRDPKILIGMILMPLIIFPIIGGIVGASMEAAKEKLAEMSIMVWNHDNGSYARNFTRYLSNSGIKIHEIEASTLEEAVSLMLNYNATLLIVIPEDFSKNISNVLEGNTLVGAEVEVFGVFGGGGVFEEIGVSVIDSLIESYNRRKAPNPIRLRKSTVVKGEILFGVDPSMVAGLMMMQSIMLPIMIMMLLTFAMQIAATSVAMEKEEKTLETLLTLPIGRFTILAGKLAGSIIVAAVGALAYLVGFSFYMGSFIGAIPTEELNLDLASLGLAPSALGYVLLGTSLFVSLLSALALAIILSAFAENVRSAQSLIGFIYPLIFVPSFVLMYLDISLLPFPLRILILAIPYSHPILTSKAVIMGDHLTAVLGILYVSAFTVAILYVAAKLFATEKILTVKLRMKSFRRKKKTK